MALTYIVNTANLNVTFKHLSRRWIKVFNANSDWRQKEQEHIAAAIIITTRCIRVTRVCVCWKQSSSTWLLLLMNADEWWWWWWCQWSMVKGRNFLSGVQQRSPSPRGQGEKLKPLSNLNRKPWRFTKRKYDMMIDSQSLISAYCITYKNSSAPRGGLGRLSPPPVVR